MSTEDNNLFEGIQILSPQDIDRTPTNDDNDGEEGTSSGGDNEGLSLVPPTNEYKVATENIQSNEFNEEEENKPPVTKESQGTTSEEKRSQIYKGLLKELADEGLIDLGDEEEVEGTLAFLKEKFGSTINKKTNENFESWKNNFSGAKKRFLEIENSFSNEELAMKVASDLEFFEKVTDTEIENDKDLAKNLYARLLDSKGFNRDQIIEAIEDADALDKLTEKAIAALPVLKKGAEDFISVEKQRTVHAMQSRQEAQIKSFNDLMNTIDSVDQLVDGMKLNKPAKDKIKKGITDVVYTDDNGRQFNSLGYKQLQNQKGFEILLTYLDSIGIFNMDKDGNFKPDLSKLVNVAKTKAVNDLDRIIDSEDKNVGMNTSDKVSTRTSGILDMLERGGMGKNKK